MWHKEHMWGVYGGVGREVVGRGQCSPWQLCCDRKSTRLGVQQTLLSLDFANDQLGDFGHITSLSLNALLHSMKRIFPT